MQEGHLALLPWLNFFAVVLCFGIMAIRIRSGVPVVGGDYALGIGVGAMILEAFDE